MALDISKLNEIQLTSLMGKVQARLSELQLQKVARVRDKVIAMITSEGVDYAELIGHTKVARREKANKVKVKQKYRNPADPRETWSGRGRQPRWFAAAIKAGKKESSLLIK